jgi:hypothetical protein
VDITTWKKTSRRLQCETSLSEAKVIIKLQDVKGASISMYVHHEEPAYIPQFGFAPAVMSQADNAGSLMVQHGAIIQPSKKC